MSTTVTSLLDDVRRGDESALSRLFALVYDKLVEIARIWVLASLGPRWTTRIIVLPEAPLVRRGPYRFFNHPNYLIVVAEIAVLPLGYDPPDARPGPVGRPASHSLRDRLQALRAQAGQVSAEDRPVPAARGRADAAALIGECTNLIDWRG